MVASVGPAGAGIPAFNGIKKDVIDMVKKQCQECAIKGDIEGFKSALRLLKDNITTADCRKFIHLIFLDSGSGHLSLLPSILALDAARELRPDCGPSELSLVPFDVQLGTIQAILEKALAEAIDKKNTGVFEAIVRFALEYERRKDEGKQPVLPASELIVSHRFLSIPAFQKAYFRLFLVGKEKLAAEVYDTLFKLSPELGVLSPPMIRSIDLNVLTRFLGY